MINEILIKREKREEKKGKEREKKGKKRKKREDCIYTSAGSKGRLEERASASYETAASGSAKPPMICYAATTNLNSHHGGKVSVPWAKFGLTEQYSYLRVWLFLTVNLRLDSGGRPSRSSLCWRHPAAVCSLGGTDDACGGRRSHGCW